MFPVTEIEFNFSADFKDVSTSIVDLLCKSPYSVRIQENMDQKKLRLWTLFTQCIHNESPICQYCRDYSNDLVICSDYYFLKTFIAF